MAVENRDRKIGLTVLSALLFLACAFALARSAVLAAALSVPLESTTTVAIAASADDADSNAFGGVDFQKTYINLPAWSRGYWRFAIDLPADSTVNTAYLELRADSGWSGDHVAHFKLLDDADCADFTSDPYNQPTWGDVAWVTPTGTQGNTWHSSADIAALVRHFIAYPAYAPGNHLCLAWYPDTTAADRSVWSFDGGYPARLVLNTSQGGPPPTATPTPVATPTATAAPTSTPTATPTPDAAVRLTRYPYVQKQTTTSILIAWRTDVGGDSKVEYGPTTAYGQQVYEPALTTEHALTLSGLQPDSLYYYRVSSNDVVLAEEAFRTAPDQASPGFTFVVFGDSGAASQAQYDVAALIESIDPDLGINTGDVIYPDSGVNEYDTGYFQPYQNLLKSTAFYPTLGNHDVSIEGGNLYLSDFYLPANNPEGTERYYSFDYGNAHFVALNTEGDYSTGGPQYTWLENDLAGTDKFWKFVFLHRPPYSSGNQGSDLNVRNVLSPLFEQHNVDIVFAGHDHDYERTYPLKDFDASSRGVVYVVSGGGGAELTPIQSFNSWSVVAVEEYHAVKVSISDQVLTLEALSPYPTQGTVLDSATLDRSQPPTPTPTPAATSTPTATPTPTPTPDSSGTLLHEDFESNGPGENPADWLDQDVYLQTTDIYDTRQWGGTMAYGTGGSVGSVYSHYDGANALDWSGYEVTGRLLFETASDGVGLTFYSHWPNGEDKWYILMRYAGEDRFRIAAHGTNISDGATSVTLSPQAGSWYQVRIQVETLSNKTLIRARVWQEGTAEPDYWQIDAYDGNATRLTAGTVGVWSIGAGGTKLVDDLHVQSLQTAPPTPTPTPTPTFTPTPTPTPHNYYLNEDFNSYQPGDEPANWVDQDWNMVPADYFEVVDAAGARAYGTTQAFEGLYSHYSTAAALAWQDYEVRGKMYFSDNGGGIGLTFYSHYPDQQDRFYSFIRYGGESTVRLAAHGANVTEGTFGADIGAVPGQWYDFRVRVETRTDRVLVHAKAWPTGDPEPGYWPIDAYFGYADRITAGTIGIWSMGPGLKAVDDLQVVPVTPLYYLQEDFEGYSPGQDPDAWLDQDSGLAAGDYFQIVTAGQGLGLGTGLAHDSIHAHHDSAQSGNWSNYEFSGRMRYDDDTGGVGVTLLSQYPGGDDRYYRLFHYPGEPAWRLAARGTTITNGATQLNITVRTNTWYYFRIQVETLIDRVSIRARVWAEGASEPTWWQLDAYDGNNTRPTAGTVGVWTMGGGGKTFDDLAVVSLAGTPTSPTPTPAPTATPAGTSTATPVPTATATPTPTPTPAGSPTPAAGLYLEEDFEGYGPAQDPVDWLDQAGNFSSGAYFQTASLDGGTVLQATDPGYRYTHYNGAGALAWSDYEYTARVRFGENGDGIALTFYSQFPNGQDRYYQLLRYAGWSDFRLSAHGTGISDGVTAVNVNAQPNTWYRIRLRVHTGADRVRIVARVWAEGLPEPEDWQIDAYDGSASRPTAGTVGVWSQGNGARAVDDVRVRSLDPPPPAGFSLGLYDVSAADFNAVQAAGFGRVHKYDSSQSEGDAIAYLQAAGSTGLEVIQNMPSNYLTYSEAFWTGRIDALSPDSALATWYLPEEPTNLSAIQRLHDLVRVRDPAFRPAGTYFANLIDLAQFCQAVDALFIGSYPEYWGEPRVNMLARLEIAQETCPAAPVVGVAMLFDSNFDGSGDYPTPSEARADAYTALIAGARGLQWYSYPYSQNLPDLWQAVQTVAAELDSLNPVISAPDSDPPAQVAILSGPLQSPESAGRIYGSIQFSQKDYQGDTYIFAVNVATGTVVAEFSGLPVTGGEVAVLFEDRSLPLAGGAFSDTFAEAEVHVYRVTAGGGSSSLTTASPRAWPVSLPAPLFGFGTDGWD